MSRPKNTTEAEDPDLYAKSTQPDDAVTEHMMFQAPWRDLIGVRDDGKLSHGPWYGPRNPEAWNRQMAEYKQSTSGGGLWDREQDPRGAWVKKQSQRYDHEKMSAFVEKNSRRIPMRELEVYYAYYRDMMGKGSVARLIGVSVATVEVTLRSLRHRMKGRK